MHFYAKKFTDLQVKFNPNSFTKGIRFLFAFDKRNSVAAYKIVFQNALRQWGTRQTLHLKQYYQ